MSNIKDFIIKDGELTKYTGKDSDVVIPESVKSIGSGAFPYHKNLTSVTIPSSVTTIDKFAFYSCKNLTDIIIPDSVTSIGDRAFYGCRKLADADGFVIVKDVLYGYYGVKEKVVIPRGVTAIGNCAFYSCLFLESVIFSDTVTCIGGWAFAKCESLTAITIPESVTSIGYAAFHACKSLESVTIPDSASIDDCAFNACNKLADEDGFIIIKDVLYSYKGSLTDIDIPDSVTGISGYAFNGFRNLNSVSIPSSVTRISKRVFEGCGGIKYFVLPEHINVFSGSVLEQFWDASFETDSKIGMIVAFLKYAPDSVITDPAINKKIKANKKKIVACAVSCREVGVIRRLFAMYKRISLDELDEYIHDAIDSPESRAYFIEYKNSHYSLEEQEKAESDKVDKELGLKEYTVAELKKLFGYERTEDGLIITSYKGTETNVIVPSVIGKEKVIAIGDASFTPARKRLTHTKRNIRNSIISVIIPEGVKSIGEFAFYKCSSLTDITLPDSLTSIGKKAFFGCYNLIVSASEGSYAEGYAIKNGINLDKFKFEYQ